MKTKNKLYITGIIVLTVALSFVLFGNFNKEKIIVTNLEPQEVPGIINVDIADSSGFVGGYSVDTNGKIIDYGIFTTQQISNFESTRGRNVKP